MSLSLSAAFHWQTPYPAHRIADLRGPWRQRARGTAALPWARGYHNGSAESETAPILHGYCAWLTFKDRNPRGSGWELRACEAAATLTRTRVHRPSTGGDTARHRPIPRRSSGPAPAENFYVIGSSISGSLAPARAEKSPKHMQRDTDDLEIPTRHRQRGTDPDSTGHQPSKYHT
ncbi:hypothetical protein CMUS01_03126 [Colletotrichum musicola]|uniref:Uncharacterized protein n=1 Tax=Colletotrichum musicola TaxID=2175873 RepID=A0A8H6U6Z8_9PEZI|nr:hypothetical protein CMUS01_03126 [Colletotrichum musicola]